VTTSTASVRVTAGATTDEHDIAYDRFTERTGVISVTAIANESRHATGPRG
jgi:hypothetical protein